MTLLTNKKCTACNPKSKPLSKAKIAELLGKLNNWQLGHDNRYIEKIFKFKNFVQALDFTNKIGAIAEEEHHHPDITLGYGYCKVKLTTHAIKALHENDFIVAAKIDEISRN